MDSYPTELELVSDAELLIVWSDGQRRQYALAELRQQCPCATCREHRAGAAQEPPAEALPPVLRPEEAQPLGIVAMKPVGSYAYSIAFSDGHDTGIYPFELLRELGREA
jgi:DUF971 family protein